MMSVFSISENTRDSGKNTAEQSLNFGKRTEEQL